MRKRKRDVPLFSCGCPLALTLRGAIFKVLAKVVAFLIMTHESLKETINRERREKELPYKLGIVGFTLYAFLKTNESVPPHPEGPFELESADSEKIVLKQEGKSYTVLPKYLSPSEKADLVKKNPHLSPFLTNGPIHIVE